MNTTSSVVSRSRRQANRSSSRTSYSAGLEVAEQLLLLRIDGDDRLLAALRRKDFRVDVFELGVALGMVRACSARSSAPPSAGADCASASSSCVRSLSSEGTRPGIRSFDLAAGEVIPAPCFQQICALTGTPSGGSTAFMLYRSRHPMCACLTLQVFNIGPEFTDPYCRACPKQRVRQTIRRWWISRRPSSIRLLRRNS